MEEILSQQKNLDIFVIVKRNNFCNLSIISANLKVDSEIHESISKVQSSQITDSSHNSTSTTPSNTNVSSVSHSSSEKSDIDKSKSPRGMSTLYSKNVPLIENEISCAVYIS